MPGVGRFRSVDDMTNNTFSPETATTTPIADPGIPDPANGAPAYPSVPAQPQYYPVQPKTNVLGIVTLVLGILGFGIVPVITGHIALNQIKRTGEDGRGITLAGLILGYITLAGWLLVAFFWLAIAAIAVIGTAAGVN